MPLQSAKIKALVKARQEAKAQEEAAEIERQRQSVTPCIACDGTGKASRPNRFGEIVCVACKGSGKLQVGGKVYIGCPAASVEELAVIVERQMGKAKR